MSYHDNAVYSEVGAASMTENKCYGDVGYTSKTTRTAESKSSCTKVPVFLLLALLIVSLLATISACIALGLEIAKLKSDTATHQESQSALARRVESAENEILQLNSFNVSSVNVQGYCLALDDRIQQLNVAIEMLNSSLGSGAHANGPAPSCAALPPSSSSGYYWVRASNGSALRVYCDITRSCGNITGGWARVAELDMTNSSHQCPSSLTQHNDFNIRTCRRTESSGGCSPVTINIPYSYSRVCGRVIAYQVGLTNAFAQRSNPTLEDDYVDGVSLTRGEPRQHVWTFAAGLQEDESGNSFSTCPCSYY